MKFYISMQPKTNDHSINCEATVLDLQTYSIYNHVVGLSSLLHVGATGDFFATPATSGGGYHPLDLGFG